MLQRGQRRTRMQRAHLPDVPAEQGLLHRLRAEQVEGQRQHVLVPQHRVVPVDDRLELRLGPGGRSCAAAARSSTAMKWLLPEPNEPVRNAPRLTPVVMASATRPSAVSNACASAGVTTYSSIVAAIRVSSMLSVSRST